LGSGYDNIHNGFISPYNLTGSGIINLNYENEKIKSNHYKTMSSINFKGSSLRLDHVFVNKLEKGPYNFNIGLSIDKSYLFKIYGDKKFSFWSGFVSSFQSNLQMVIYDARI
jgi:hypothetical protein